MRTLLMGALAALACASTAAAQHEGHGQHHHAPPAATEHQAHKGHDGAAVEADPDAPPPAPPSDHAADRVFDAGRMARARALLRAEHGGAKVSKVVVDLLEVQPRAGVDAYRWNGEAWYGGDIHRVVLKSEGEGRDRVEAADLELLYSRAVSPFTDLQAGLRVDIEPGPTRTYAALGVESVLPYWIHAEGSLFLSDRGDLLGRVEALYDLRLTQRLILQPRAELSFAAQDIARTRTGSGLSAAELGLRLRYEIRRTFAPYVGLAYERRLGRTGDYARAAGEDLDTLGVVLGIRGFF